MSPYLRNSIVAVSNLGVKGLQTGVSRACACVKERTIISGNAPTSKRRILEIHISRIFLSEFYSFKKLVRIEYCNKALEKYGMACDV